MFQPSCSSCSRVPALVLVLLVAAASCSQECPDTPSCGLLDWGVTKPFPPDCSMYVYCDVSGGSSLRRCLPEGFHYSPTSYRCLAPEMAACPLCGGTTNTPEVTTTEPSTTEPTTTEPSTTEELTTLPECALTPSCSFSEWGTNKPFPPDCTKFVYCNSYGAVEVRSCPAGLHFSPSSSACASLETANCPACQSSL